MSTALQVTEIENRDQIPFPAPPPRRPVEVLPWLPCTLALDVQVIRFTVRSLLELAPGRILETSCHQSMDIPLRVNGLLMAWTEFEVVGERLAARITDLA
jgi:flagellar motor switch/type III secretory pathway protein FliN